jgi:hypothetical protein
MFSTRLSDVSADDIRNAIDGEATESIDFELKKALSADSGADPWMTGGKIGDRAKDVLATEIVAFANTSGGTMIVGIDEDPQTKAARAPIYPIPRCKEAAAILHQALSARIEPRVPVFECEGVVTEQDGSSGVIIMRVLESYLAPHRNTKNNECYVRRNDRAEPMSMVEIQELTRRVARSGAVIEKAFSDSGKAFFNWIPEPARRTHPARGLQGSHSEQGGNKQYTGLWTVRLTAVPLRPLSLGKLPRQPWLKDIQIESFNGPGRQGSLRAYDVQVVRQWVPRLRSVEREFNGAWSTAVDRIGAEGQIERYALAKDTMDGARSRALQLDMSQLIWNVASVIRMIDMIRARADRPTQDYALEIELMCSDPMHMTVYPGPVPLGLNKMPAGSAILPRYQIGARDDFNEVLTTVDGDLWNMAGNHPDWELAVDWPAAR